MNKEEVLAFIESCNSNADCAEIQKAARDRGAAIRNAAYKAQVDEYWKRAIFFREGQTLYCAAEGTFIGGPLQRGDKCTVHEVEAGRRKLLWIKVRKEIIGLPPNEVHRYRLQTKRPEKPNHQARPTNGKRLKQNNALDNACLINRSRPQRPGR